MALIERALSGEMNHHLSYRAQRRGGHQAHLAGATKHHEKMEPLDP